MTSLSIDFETRATVDLRSTGVYRYARHPDTDIWCFAWAFDDEEPEIWLPLWRKDGTTWHLIRSPYYAASGVFRVLQHIYDGGEIRAWNAQFERIIWREIMVPRYGALPIRDEQWVCSAAEAAAMALPRSLDGAATVLKVQHQKDRDGYALMMQMTRPRGWYKSTGQGALFEIEPPDGVPVWWNTPDKLERLYEYCKQDVRTERAIVKALRRLTPHEREVYLLDQRINDRGFRIDRELVEAAQAVATTGIDRANIVITEMTGGEVSAITQHSRLATWVKAQGIATPGIGRDDVRDLLDLETLDPRVRAVLEARADAGKSSIAKLLAMRDQADPADDRVRGTLLYHGASTGRWTGRGVQPQNFPRGEFTPDALEAFIPDVLAGRYDHIDLIAHPISVVSALLRGCIVAAPGHELVVADYNAIEARVLNWLAEQDDVVAMFARGLDVYSVNASRLPGAAPFVVGEKHQLRLTGKFQELGCGYGMGAKKAVTAAGNAPYNITLNEANAKEIVDGYRSSHPMVRAFWYAVERACVQATENPAVPVRFGVRDLLCAVYAGAYLYIVLPSGRPLCFAAPHTAMADTPWGAEKLTLFHWGVDVLSKKWVETSTYGGLLVENIVSAIARDLMVEGMLRVEAAGYPVILSVHDEVVSEVPSGYGSVGEFERLLAALPDWAAGLPVKAEGWRGARYHK